MRASVMNFRKTLFPILQLYERNGIISECIPRKIILNIDISYQIQDV